MKEGDVILRDADVADLDTFVALELACYPAPWSRMMYQTELSRPGGIRIAAEVDGTLVGGVLGAEIGDWHLLNVLVSPEHRGRGIGGQLVDAFLDRIAPAPATLEVRVSNAAAIHLYEGRGFASVGLRTGYYVGGEDACIMWRPPVGAARDWQPST